MKTVVYAGVDGGGTKTTVVLIDVSGKEVARHTTSSSNAAVVGHEAAGQVLREAMEHVLEEVDASLGGAWLGLSGGDRPEDHHLLRPHLRHLSQQLRFTNDAELALGALPEESGLVVVAGTGSIAFGRSRSGERIRAGGWGHIMGDEGSGYDLARRMLVAIAAHVDGNGPATSLRERLMTHLSLDEPFQLIGWVYAKERTKGEIAGLSSLVLEAADDGDRVALTIVQLAAEDLASTAVAAGRRLNPPTRLAVALAGGLLTGSERFRAAFLAALKNDIPDIDVSLVFDPALIAARSLVADINRSQRNV
jgi:glucosamine kinase